MYVSTGNDTLPISRQKKKKKETPFYFTTGLGLLKNLENLIFGQLLICL